MAATAKETSERQAVSTEIGTAVKHSFIYGFGAILLKVLGFLLLPLYTHYLSPQNYGVLEVLDTSMSLLAMLLSMGTMNAFLRYYGAAQTDEERREVVGTSFLFTAGTGLLVFVLGVGAVPIVSRHLLGPTVPPSYLLLSFSYFVISYIGSVPWSYLRAKEASGRFVLVDTLSTLGILVLSVLFLSVLKLGLVSMLLSPLIISPLRLAVMVKWMSPDMVLRVDWNLLRRILRFGFPLVFANLTMFTLNFSDRFFLQRLVSLEVVGIYAVGYKFGYLLNFLLVQSFTMMWQARMYVVHKRPDHQKVFAQVFVLYSFALVFSALGLSLFSREAIRLMADPRYAEGSQVVGLVALAYVFLGIGNYVQLAMFLGHRTGLIGAVSMGAAIINLGANYILISAFGMMGAAAATLLGFLVLAVGSYYCSERVMAMHLPLGRVFQGLCVAIAVYALDQRVAPTILAWAVVVKLLFLAGFAASLRWWLLSGDELDTLGSLRRSATAAAGRALRFGSARA